MNRTVRLICNAIRSFGIDLSGITVLTEAATGDFAVTPVIALMAGAERVICLTRDSKYSSAREAIEQTISLTRTAGLERLPEIYTERESCPIENANIVTNLGFVRPLDKQLIKRLAEKSVISLMWEPWELRDSEIDLAACENSRVLVVGTNESDQRLMTLNYLGLTVLKLLLLLELEVLGNRCVILSDCSFGQAVENVLKSNGADTIVIDLPQWFNLKNNDIETLFTGADALIFLVHRSDQSLLDVTGAPELQSILSIAPDLKVVHISGNVEPSLFKQASVPYLPRNFAPPFYMSVNTSYVGIKPVIDLHAAGLHIGATCFRLLQNDNNFEKVVKQSQLSCPALGINA